MAMPRILLSAVLLSGWALMACDRAPAGAPASDAPASAQSSVEPPKEVIHQPACPFEGCQLGRWTAREPVAIYDEPAGSATERAVAEGQAVEALKAQVRAVPRRATVTAVYQTDEAQGIRLGGVVYALHPIGEGALAIWHEGAIKEGSLDLALRYDDAASALDWTWWVQVRLSDGTTAWLKDPQRKFDGMDGRGV